MRILQRGVVPLVVALIASFSALAQSAPAQSTSSEPLSINKLEPPNWWSGMPQSPMLLVSGRGLADAKVSVNYPGVQVERVQAQPSGHYLFVWLKVAPTAKAGTVKLNVGTARGSLTLDFPLLSHGNRKPGGVSKDDVIYLIMPDRFANGNTANDNPAEAPGQTNRKEPRMWHGGDLKGVADHLAYLKQLGISAIWLTPWWKQDTTTSDYHGYHVVDFYAVEPHLGTMNELQQMSAEAHKLGMKVIIDFVVNHTGPLHPWAQDPPTATWLHGTPRKHMSPEYDFAQLVDPHASPRQYRPLLEGWFADRLPDLNPDDPLLEAYLRDNAIWWTEMASLDGMRLDTFPYSSRKFWSQWHNDVRKVYPNMWTLGEVFNGDPWITSYFVGGHKQTDGVDDGVTTVFDFPLMFAIRDVTLHEGDARKIVNVLQHDNLYSDPNGLVTFLGNHDTRRYMGEDGASVQKLKATISLLATLRGIPQLYSGDEIAMPGGDDPDNRHDFPGGFAGDTKSAFTTEGRSAEEQAVFEHTQAMLKLRREHPALRDGTLHHISVAEGHYAFLRESGDDRLLIVFNSKGSAQHLDLTLSDTPLQNVHSLEPLYSAEPAQIDNAQAVIPISGMSIAVYKVR